MTAQAVFFNDFSEKDPHLNAVEVWAWACAIARHSRPGMASVIHKKTRLQDKLLFHWSSWCEHLIVIDESGPFHQ